MRSWKFLGLAAVALTGCDVETSTQAVELSSDFSSMRVKSGRGSVTLRPSMDGSTVRIEADLYGKHTSFQYEVDGDELVSKRHALERRAARRTDAPADEIASIAPKQRYARLIEVMRRGPDPERPLP